MRGYKELNSRLAILKGRVKTIRKEGKKLIRLKIESLGSEHYFDNKTQLIQYLNENKIVVTYWK